MEKKIKYTIALMFILVASLYSQDVYRELKVKELKKINAYTTVYITDECDGKNINYIDEVLSYYKKGSSGIPWSKIIFDIKYTNNENGKVIEYGMYVYDIRALYNRQAFEYENQKHETLNEMHYGGLFASLLVPKISPDNKLSCIMFEKKLLKKYPNKFNTYCKGFGYSDDKIKETKQELNDCKVNIKIMFGLIDKDYFVQYESDIFEYRIFNKWMGLNNL